MADASFVLQVLIALGTLVSLLLHKSHSEKLQKIGDTIDSVDRTAAASLAKPAAPAGFAAVPLMAVLAVAAIALSPLATGCGAKQKAAEQTFLTCAETDVIAELKPTVESILSSGGADWQKQLDGLAIAFGKDALGCAVEAYAQMFGAGSGAEAGSNAQLIAERARTYLADRSLRMSR